MISLKKMSDKKLVDMLHNVKDETILSDNKDIFNEIARRIRSGLIPLAEVGFSKLTNKKLDYLEALTNCDWALEEIVRRMKDGRIKTKIVTVEEAREEIRKVREKSLSKSNIS